MAGGLCLAVVLCCPPLSPYFCLALEPPSLLSIRLLPLQNQFPAVTGSPEKRNPLLGQLSLPYPRVSRRGLTRPPSHPGRERSAAQHRALATISYYCSAALNRLGFTGTDLFRLSGY